MLQVELPLDGQPRRARIPGSWQLCVWVDADAGFWRHDVRRDTTVRALRASAVAFMRVPAESVDLCFGCDATPLDDDATAEELSLFSRRRECRVSIRQVRVVFHGVPPPPEAAPSRPSPRD